MTLFKKKYAAQVEIQSTSEKVWNVLTDLPQYEKWNPFTIRVDTKWEIGSEVLLTVQMHEGRKPILQKEYLTRFNPQKEICWGLDWGIWLQAERRQKIVEISPSLVRYETEDIIRGPLCPLVHALYGIHIQRGFERMAIALKKYIEQT